MNKIMYCTLDTETIGGASHPTGMYNLGCVIHDNEGNIFATTSMLVMEHYDKIKDDDYAKKNFHLYEERIMTGEMSAVATEEDALDVVKNLCHYYNVKYVMAYNSAFDFTKTICRDLLNDFEFIDIYLMALQTVTHLKKYQKFCVDNNFKSNSKQSCSTTAQTVFAYFTNNVDYEEEHTALSDSLIEMQIFVSCRKMHKKYTKNCHQFNCKVGKCFPSLKITKTEKRKTEIEPVGKRIMKENNCSMTVANYLINGWTIEEIKEDILHNRELTKMLCEKEPDRATFFVNNMIEREEELYKFFGVKVAML